MQVLDQDHPRRPLARGMDQPLHDREQLPLPGLGVRPRGRSLGVGDAEELEQQRERVAEPLVEEHERAGDLPAGGVVAVLLGHPEVAAQQLQHGEEGDELPVRHPVRLVDRDAPGTAALGELVDEPALADAGLGHHPHHLRTPRQRVRQHRLEGSHLVVAPDEAREAACAGQVQAGAERTDALELEDPERVAHPLYREAPEVSQAEEAGDERRAVLGQIDLARLGELFHPRREPHSVALGGVVHAQVVADLPDHDLARVEPHAHGEVEALRPPQARRIAAQRLAQVKRRVTGPLRVVLVGDGRPEEGHDPVARELVESPLEAMDALGEDREEAVEDAVPGLGVDLLGQVHRALHVGEEDGHLLPLAFEGGPGSEDLLREVLRRVGTWVRLVCRSGSGKGASAPETEVHLRSVRPPASGAGSLGLQRAAAVAAEGGVVGQRSLAAGAGHAPSSRATCSARIGAPISANSRCASRSSRWRVASSPVRRASAARSTWTSGA